MLTITDDTTGHICKIAAVPAERWKSEDRFFGNPEVRYLCGDCGAQNKQRCRKEEQFTIAFAQCQLCDVLNFFPIAPGVILTVTTSGPG